MIPRTELEERIAKALADRTTRRFAVTTRFSRMDAVASTAKPTERTRTDDHP